MNYRLRSIQLIGAAALSTLVISTEAGAAEVQESNRISSPETYTELSKTDETIVIQDDSPTVLQIMPKHEHTFDTELFTESTFEIVRATEPTPEQPLTESVLNAMQQTSGPVEERPIVEPASPQTTTELPEFGTSADLLPPPESVDSDLIAQDIPPAEEVFPTPEEATPDEGELEPGRRTRSGPSYVGIGANFGTVGDSSVGESGLIIYSKIGLTRFFSVRPAVTTDFEGDATFLLPATLDVAPIRINNDIRLAPYFGGGAALSTQGDFGPLLVGGVDLPVTSDLTATAGVNFAILDPVDLGIFVGLSYNFSEF